MKKIIFLTICILLALTFITSCSQITLEQNDNQVLQKQLKEKEQQIHRLKQKIVQLDSVISDLQEENKEVVYDKNRFDLNKIHVGDSIMGLIVSDVQIGWDGWEGSYIIKFFGDIELTGQLINHPDDGYFAGIEFIADDESQKRIPLPVGEQGLIRFEVNNSGVLESVLEVTDKEKDVTLVLSDLIIGSSKDKPWSNTANFIKVINAN